MKEELISTLEMAKRLIQRTGWCQGDYEQRNDFGQICAYCASGAIIAASPRIDRQLLALKTVASVANGGHSLWVWNDTKGRTKAEVIDAFDRAIAVVKEWPLCI